MRACVRVCVCVCVCVCECVSVRWCFCRWSVQSWYPDASPLPVSSRSVSYYGSISLSLLLLFLCFYLFFVLVFFSVVPYRLCVGSRYRRRDGRNRCIGVFVSFYPPPSISLSLSLSLSSNRPTPRPPPAIKQQLHQTKYTLETRIIAIDCHERTHTHTHTEDWPKEKFKTKKWSKLFCGTHFFSSSDYERDLNVPENGCLSWIWVSYRSNCEGRGIPFLPFVIYEKSRYLSRQAPLKKLDSIIFQSSCLPGKYFICQWIVKLNLPTRRVRFFVKNDLDNIELTSIFHGTK